MGLRWDEDGQGIDNKGLINMDFIEDGWEEQNPWWEDTDHEHSLQHEEETSRPSITRIATHRITKKKKHNMPSITMMTSARMSAARMTNNQSAFVNNKQPTHKTTRFREEEKEFDNKKTLELKEVHQLMKDPVKERSSVKENMCKCMRTNKHSDISVDWRESDKLPKLDELLAKEAWCNYTWQHTWQQPSTEHWPHQTTQYTASNNRLELCWNMQPLQLRSPCNQYRSEDRMPCGCVVYSSSSSSFFKKKEEE